MHIRRNTDAEASSNVFPMMRPPVGGDSDGNGDTNGDGRDEY